MKLKSAGTGMKSTVVMKPWMVSLFPEQLRRDFVADCTRKGETVAERLVKLVSKDLLGSKK